MVFIPLMDIDASQYASMSREMLENKSYLQVFDLGALIISTNHPCCSGCLH
jgi:hypothetical protein